MRGARSEGEPPDVERLLAVCLEAYEARGPRAVDEVLAEHPDSSEAVRERLDVLGRMGLVGEPPEDAIPERIGDYAILGVLGRGGMGVVYEAQQERPRRRVALKVLRTLPSGQRLSRFRHEAELLGRLQHPGIAQVYAVGTAPVGGLTVPYFAMELVRGERIDEYARQQRLGVRGKLALLAKVADAVHHAHQKGVVHRDLKPANVLVDERGEPRVLDFGIARAIDPDLELETLRTEAGQLVGTLPYMSPEQAAGDSREIDSRTDVYSLGVVAYELLTGDLPHETAGLSVLETLMVIREDEAPRLSLADRSLRGDVETIVAKALEKEKERRYSSAHELAADLRRHLNHEPITAHPATALYQLRKFSRRHRALVGGAAAFLLALSLGLVGTLRGMISAARERDDAERRFRQANAVLAFQKRMFAAADPEQEGVRVEDLLDRAVLLVEERGDPVERAAVRLMLGEAYESIGLFQKANPLIAEAAATFERELGLEDLQTLSARISLAELFVGRFIDLDEAEKALEGVAETAARVHGPAHEVTLRARLTHSRVEFERGRFEEAARIAREVLELAGDDRSLWAGAMHQLATSLEQLSRTDEALDAARELYASSLETYGQEHPATWGAMNTLGNMLRDAGRIGEAGEILEELLAQRSEHLGPSHPDTINAQSNLAIECVHAGDLERAEKLLLGAVAACDERYPPGHPERLFPLNTLAGVYMMQGRFDRAEELLREVVELSTENRGREHLDTTSAMGNLARTLGQVGRNEEAEALFEEALAIRRETLGDRNAETLATMFMFGQFLTHVRRYEDADPLLQEVVETGREVLPEGDFILSLYLRGLGRNLLALDRLDEAEEALRESYELGERTRPGHVENKSVLQTLAALYGRLNRPEEAAHARELLEAASVPEH